MSGRFRAFHLRIGDGPLAAFAEAWLDAHAAETRCCRDVFAACAAMARGDAWQPDVVLLSTDWLAADELEIADFARRAWPDATVVAYGSGFEEHLRLDDARVIRCESTAAFRRALDAIGQVKSSANDLAATNQRLHTSPVAATTDGIGPCRVAERGDVGLRLSADEIAVLLGPEDR